MNSKTDPDYGGWKHSLHGDGGRQGWGQLGSAAALHQLDGLLHLHLVVEGDQLRFSGALVHYQALLHVLLIKPIQPGNEKEKVKLSFGGGYFYPDNKPWHLVSLRQRNTDALSGIHVEHTDLTVHWNEPNNTGFSIFFPNWILKLTFSAAQAQFIRTKRSRL